MDVIGLRRSRSSGGNGCCVEPLPAPTPTPPPPRSSTCGIRRSADSGRGSGSGSVFGGLGSSSLSGAAERGVDVVGGWPLLELENEDFVRLMGV